VVDEINRADLGRVLGEAIYLFEAESGAPRSVRLPHAIDGSQTFTLPANLHVLATMNTADRSVARMDLAIRRRFAFVTMMPDRAVVQEHSTPTGLALFDALCDVFLEFAPDDALALLPGHSYFLVRDGDEAALRTRLRRDVRLQCSVDPELIGGAVVRSGDLLIDGSLKGKLERLETELTG
jgi:5-methylcytosine-specific restriction protein B